MTEAGAARWRIAAEKAFNEGKIHLETAQEISSEMIATLKQGSEQLEQAATKAITHLSEASSSFRTSQFKNAAANACDMIRNMASNQITKLAELIKWFHWKNLAMAIAVSLFITFLAGLYLNGEWPWDIHARVIKERNAGQMLLAAWPKLTPSEQQDIINGSKKAGGST
jgi:polyhydroxyalkanoate synthesis regulator phasin